MTLLEEALSAKRESRRIEFKESFDHTSDADWCELIKDIVAIGNSGGGVIVIGLKNNGVVSGWDSSALLIYDPAKITDKIATYTNHQFEQFDVSEAVKDSSRVACVSIGASDIPIVFVRPGTYVLPDGKQKTAFGRGTLYFRHGAKSEPASNEDLARSFKSAIEQFRKVWFRGIRQITQTKPGDTVQIVKPTITGSRLREVKLSSKGVPVHLENADNLWPYRQIDIVRMVNERLGGQYRVNPYDIRCIRLQYNIENEHQEFMYKPFKNSAPQFSEAFVEWLVHQYEKDPGVFRKARVYKSEH